MLGQPAQVENDEVESRGTVMPGRLWQPASMSPALFQIPADLAQMRVKAGIDESDLGQIPDGQSGTFTANACTGELFTGVVRQEAPGSGNLGNRPTMREFRTSIH